MKWLQKHGTITELSKINDFLVSFCFKSMMVIGVSLANFFLSGVKIKQTELLEYQVYFNTVINNRQWCEANKLLLLNMVSCFLKFLEVDNAYKVCFVDMLKVNSKKLCFKK